MASYIPPKKGVEYITYVCLTSQANTNIMQTNPTLAAGDATVTTDGNAVTNLDTLPAVTPAGSVFVKVTVSAAEMNGANIIIRLHDVAGAEWCDLSFNIPTSSNTLEGHVSDIRGADSDTLKHLSDQLDTAQNDLDDLVARLTAARAGYLDELAAANLPADVDTLKGYCDILDHATNGLANIKSLIDTLDTVADGIKAVTDLLPNAGALNDLAAILTDTGVALPATLATIVGYIDTEVAAILAAVDTEVAAIKAVTDLLPNAGALNDLATLEGRLTALRAGYLDNLSVGAVALEATLTAMKGAGWDATTDTLEAIRNAITAIADLAYEPDASSVIATGNEIANTWAALAADNGVRWQIQDTGIGDGLDVICEFNLPTTRRAIEVHINGYFSGAGGPVEIYVWNYVSASWNKLSAGTPGTEMRNRANDRDYVFPLTVGNTDVVTAPGEVKIRFLTESSNAGDDLFLDYVAIIAAATATILPEAVANAVWEFDIRNVRVLAAGEYPAGHIIKRLVALGTDVAVSDTARSFTLTDGRAADKAYEGMLLEIRDESSATRDVETREITGWTAGRVVIVDRDFSFVPAVGDHVHITCGYITAPKAVFRI